MIDRAVLGTAGAGRHNVSLVVSHGTNCLQVELYRDSCGLPVEARLHPSIVNNRSIWDFFFSTCWAGGLVQRPENFIIPLWSAPLPTFPVLIIDADYLLLEIFYFYYLLSMSSFPWSF